MTVQLDFIGVVVSDMAASLDFYRRLGLETPTGAEKEPHVEVALPGGMRLAFDTVETVLSFDPQWRPPMGGHRIGLAFHCADPAEVDRVYGELTGAGYGGHREPWDAVWGQRYAQVRDPDGNVVDLYAPLA